MSSLNATHAQRSFLDSHQYGRIRRIVLAILTVAVIVVIFAWPAITNFYTYNDNYYNGLVASAAISAILTMSLNLCMGYSGLLSLMHTGLQLIGGYAVATVSVKAGLPWTVGVVAAIAVGAVFSVLVISVSLRATYLYFGMITLAANLVLVEAGRSWQSLTGGVVGISGIYPTQNGEILSKTAFYYVTIVIAALVYIVQRNLVKSGVGRAAMAARESPDTASAMGIRPARIKVTIFAISGGIGGLAGGLYALQLNFINPDVGIMENGLIFFLGLFLGGIGTLVGPLVGVGAITILMELIKSYSRYTTLILGLILLFAMMIIPLGIVGTWNKSRLGRAIIDDDDDVGSIGDVPDSVPRVPADAAERPALEGAGLYKHFGGVRAVDGVDVKFMPGTVHGIIGPNGSGKSTLIGCLTSYIKPREGQVLIDGAKAPRLPFKVAAHGVTRVFQVPHLFERVSVLDNVLTGMRMHETYTWMGAAVRSPSFRRQDRARRQEAMGLLRFAGLENRAHWMASTLSHGQKRLLEVVRAVATRPRVLILDEPATGLTVDELQALAQLCRELRKLNIAVVLIEHNIEFIMGLCDEITVIDTGHVIERGSPEHVRASPAVIEAYLGADVGDEAL